MIPLLSGHRAMAVLLVALAALYLPWSASPHPGDLDGDSATYFLTARHFAPYLAAEAPAAHAARLSQFPPLYPLVLALAGGAASVPAAHAVTALCLLAALVACYAWLLALGVGRGWATAATALFGLMPGTWLLALSLLSEPLYLALSLAALALLARAQETRTYAWAALAIAAAILARTAGVALLPALAFALWRGRPRGASWILLLALAPPLAWSLVPRGQPGYLGEFADMDTSLSGIAAWIASGAGALVHGVGENVIQGGADGGRATLCGAALLLVALTRARRPGPDFVYLLAYAALIVLWPYPTHAPRFAWVIVPPLLGHAFLAAQRLRDRMHALAPPLPQAAPVVLACVLALTMAPALLAGVARWRDPLATTYEGIRQLREWYGRDALAATRQSLLQWHLMRGLAELGAQVPPDGCLLATGWPTVTFHTRRVTWEVPDALADDAALRAAVARAGCDHFMLLGVASPIVPIPFYPEARLAGGLERIAAYPAGQEHPLLALARRRVPDTGTGGATPAP